MESKKLNKRKLLLIFAFLAGAVTPFIPSFIVVEVFFFIIPFAIIFIFTLAYLIISSFNKNLSSKRALFTFSILPIFIISQLVSGFVVDKVQRFRSENIISDIYQIRDNLGTTPEKYDTSLGINYKRLRDNTTFMISYSRGFMVTEKYDSESKTWKSYGWND